LTVAIACDTVPKARTMAIDSAGGALHCTIVGDFAYVTRGEVEEFLASDDDEIQR
jgi:hypothetical protein